MKIPLNPPFKKGEAEIPPFSKGGIEGISEIREFCNISINLGIPTASPFRKGGLRGIFLIKSGLIEHLRKFNLKP